MKDGDVAALPDFFAMLQDAGVDAAIVSDMGALSVCKRVAPKARAASFDPSVVHEC